MSCHESRHGRSERAFHLRSAWERTGGSAHNDALRHPESSACSTVHWHGPTQEENGAGAVSRNSLFTERIGRGTGGCDIVWFRGTFRHRPEAQSHHCRQWPRQVLARRL